MLKKSHKTTTTHTHTHTHTHKQRQQKHRTRTTTEATLKCTEKLRPDLLISHFCRGSWWFTCSHQFMHKTFVATAPPPTVKGGDYDKLSVPCYKPNPQGANNEVKTLLFALPFAVQNLPGVRILLSTPSFPLHCGDTRKVTALHFGPAFPYPSP